MLQKDLIMIFNTYHCQRNNMLNRYSNNRNEPHSEHNKQNINQNEAGKIDQYERQLVTINNFQILKQSALSALIEKEKEIEALINSQQSLQENLRLQSIQEQLMEMQEHMQRMEHQNKQLKTQLGEISKQSEQQEQQWSLQRGQLISQMTSLRGMLQQIQAELDQANLNNGQLTIQNQQLYQQLEQLQVAYRLVRRQLQQSKEDEDSNRQDLKSFDDQQSHSKDKKQDRSESKTIRSEDIQSLPSMVIFEPQGNDTDKTKCIDIKEALMYETQEWFSHNSFENTSVREKHCLQGDLKALSLIDDYSVNSKHKNSSDCSSQFTAKYFKYANENHLRFYDSCENIPELPQEELVASEHATQQQHNTQNKEYAWWERTVLFVGGACAGALLLWKLTK